MISFILQGYAKMDTAITMNMQGELFEVSLLQADVLRLEASPGSDSSAQALKALTCVQAVWGAQFVDSNGDYAGASLFICPLDQHNTAMHLSLGKACLSLCKLCLARGILLNGIHQEYGLAHAAIAILPSAFAATDCCMSVCSTACTEMAPCCSGHGQL